MTKKHFIDAAAIVRNILNGEWTSDLPPWAKRAGAVDALMFDEDAMSYTRAVWTAEAFIMLFTSHNPRFDTQRFLIACGLMDKPVKVRK